MTRSVDCPSCGHGIEFVDPPDELFNHAGAPDRNGLAHNQVWMWEDRPHWVVVTLNPDGPDPNAGGSPAPVEDELEGTSGE